MGKKKRKAPQLEAWCWYCDREFEDDKVLLQHQKAKHYRCHLCPRRLNTAGGLAVHLTQVHKAEPERLENTLPGRDTFDIEIYGMAGIPERDLMEWKARRAAAASKGGAGAGANSAANKRPRIEKMVLSVEALRIQLEAHKALMSGKTPSHPPPGFGPPPPGIAAPPFGVPPASVPGLYNRPPPGFPPPNMAVPPPGIPPYGVPPPGFAGVPPPGAVVPPPGGGMGFPPPSSSSSSTMAPPPPMANFGGASIGGAPSPHQSAIKNGLKSRLVYADPEISPEEKLARTVKYLYRDPLDGAPTQVPAQGERSASADPATAAAAAAAPATEMEAKVEGGGEPPAGQDAASPAAAAAQSPTQANKGGRARASDLF
ncbi:uncharacterized protein PFL1_02123 [Pseudozyma flocculosa PF-1]|uniref:Related to zinc finger protein n=1 Tax=Pseudozyma flocculosa TaxID=84751 RepID=A0A5C3EZI3_9BASI|nr:uncharacterized protein PFL1_02123 [Pseudozyma flocculosa PF-1]EPQ30599.1 hypothetical protein PFL1_02123 [Pseudozyma flocculosa PF-1]SPO37694.1 related to zinc finger protein [Pseudozyma flocculosa]